MAAKCEENMLTALFLVISIVPTISTLRIERPQHHSVVRTQSVQIDLHNDGEVANTILELDGREISHVGERRMSIILADEQGMTEGIHNITWWTPGRPPISQALPIIQDTGIQFALDDQALACRDSQPP